MNPTRVAIAVPGIALGLFGVFRLLTQIPDEDLIELAIWLVAAVVLHDAVLSPLVAGFGWLLARTVPPRARGVVQGALIVAASITVIALPLIHREDSQPASKGILRQNYTANLAIVLGLIAVVAIGAYVLRLVRDGQRASATNVRPSDDQDSTDS